jgi:hypothetical protein
VDLQYGPLLLVSILVPGILRCYLDFLEVYTPLDWGVRLSTHVHLVLSLRMIRVIPLLPVYFFMACTETTLLSRVSLTWAIAQHIWFGTDISGQGLGPAARVNMAKTSWISSPMNTGPIPCLEVTVTNQPAPCNSPKE